MVTLAGMAAGWVVIEIAFVLHGFPGVPRYLFEPAGLTAVLAGICFGWLLLDAKRYWRGAAPWAGSRWPPSCSSSWCPRASPTPAPSTRTSITSGPEPRRSTSSARSSAALGGPESVQACGWPVLNVEYVSIMGWYLHRNTGVIGYRPKIELAKKRPDLYFTPLPNGWTVTPNHQPAGGSCDSMNGLYVPTARHPEGVFVPK